MKRVLVIAFLMVRAFSFAGEHDGFKGPPPPIKFPLAPRAWLGLEVSKPDETITAQLPSLPPGIGFVIRMIDKEGPAEAAGLQELDVLWKIGDQMLVNEGQLAALLRLRKPGDEVSVSGFRAGKPLDVKLKLGDAPVSKRPFPDDMVDDTILPNACNGPMRVIRISDKVATYSKENEGSMEVRMEGETYKVKIQGPKDELIYEGDIPKDGNLDQIPEGWRRRVHALRRGLDHALDGRMTPSRQPRPRVVPPNEPKS
jgi:hypothetical protein